MKKKLLISALALVSSLGASAQMLKEYGVKYVIIGHSERRQYFGETNETVQGLNGEVAVMRQV